MKLVVLTIAWLISLAAYSSTQFKVQSISELPAMSKSGWSSGGGNAVVCFNPAFAKDAISKINKDGSFPDMLFSDAKYINSIQVLDLFEARLMRGAIPPSPPKIIELQQGENILQYVFKVAHRFSNYVASVGNTVFQGIDLIPQANIRFYDGVVVQNRDIGHPSIINSKLCRITTIANQRSQNGFYELYIDSRAFNHSKHEKISQAVLLLHEFVYATARSRGEKDSLTARKLVEVIITKHPDFTVDYISKLAADLNFSYTQLPETSTHRRHIYNAYLIDAPMFYLHELIKKMATSTWLYSPEGFKGWTANLRKELEKSGIFPNIEDDNRLESVMTWYKNYSGELPHNDEAKRIFKELKSFSKQRQEFLRKNYQKNLINIYLAISRIPASPSDRAIIVEVMRWSFEHFINSSDVYLDVEKGKAQNSLIAFGKLDFKNAGPVIQNMWNQIHSLNFEIILGNEIP